MVISKSSQRLAESQYTISAGSSYGDVEVGSTTKEDGGTLTLGAGPYKMAFSQMMVMST